MYFYNVQDSTQKAQNEICSGAIKDWDPVETSVNVDKVTCTLQCWLQQKPNYNVVHIVTIILPNFFSCENK